MTYATATMTIAIGYSGQRPTVDELQNALDKYRRRNEYARKWMRDLRRGEGRPDRGKPPEAE